MTPLNTTVSRRQLFFANAARRSSAARSLTTILRSKSVPFWDPDKARAIEPYTPTPARRLRVIETLAKAGISVGVNVAPIIPGLNDQDIPKILTAAREAGATSAGTVLLRLPGSVKAVFEERLRAAMPLSADRVLHRIRETRGGELYDARFGVRGRGEGRYAEMIRSLFDTTAARLGFGREGGDGYPPEPPSVEGDPPEAPSRAPSSRPSAAASGTTMTVTGIGGKQKSERPGAVAAGAQASLPFGQVQTSAAPSRRES